MTPANAIGNRLRQFILALLTGVAGIVVLAAVLSGYILLTYDDEDYRTLLITTVERFSDNKLSIDGPFHLALSTEPGVSAGNLRLVSSDGGYDISIGELQTRIELRPLLANFLVVQYFRASHADIRLEESAGSEDKTSENNSRDEKDFIIPVIHEITLDDIRISYRQRSDPEPILAMLDKFAITEISAGKPVELNATGNISGTGFMLAGTLGDLQHLLKTKAPYPLDIDLQFPETSLSVDGVVGNPHEGSGLDLAIDGKAPAVEKILGLAHLSPPPLGALSVTARLEGQVNAPAVSDINVELSGKKLSLVASGNIMDAANLQGLDLRGTLDVSDPAILKWLLPGEAPELDSAKLSAEMRSKDADYVVSDLTATVSGRKGLVVSLDGDARFSRSDQPLQDINATITYNARDTSALREISDDVPLAGPVSLSAELGGSSNRLSVSKLRLHAGDENTVYLNAKGSLAIDNLTGTPALGSVDIWTMLAANSTAALSDITGTEIPDLGKLNANAVLKNINGHPGLHELDLRLRKGREITLHAKGSIDRLDTLGDIDIKVDLLAASLAALGKPFSQTLPDEGQVKLEAQVSGQVKDFNLKGQIKLARTRIQAELQTLPGAARPKISGTLNIPMLHVGDLGLHPADQPAQATGEAEAGTSGLKTGLFSTDPFELGGMNAADIDLKIVIGRIQGTEKLFDDLQAHITLDNGLLEIKPLELTYEGGKIIAHSSVNSRTHPASMALKIEGDDLRMGTLLAEKKGDDVPLRGLLSTDIDITSKGQSVAALAGNLNGHINAMTENAKVKRHYADVLAKDVLGWALSSIFAPDKMGNIDCGLFVTRAEQGVIRTKTFLLDSAITEIRVDATVDLGKESIQAIIYPKRKRRLWNSAKPIEISGPLSDPTIKATTVAEISTTAAQTALFTPVLVTRDLLGRVTGRDRNRDAKDGGCSKYLAGDGE